MGIPLVCFFADFDALIPCPLGRKALEILTIFCQILGISPKAAKSQVGEKVGSLGVEGTFPSPANAMKLSVRLTPEKASMWIDALKLFLRQSRVGHRVLESLIGKLGCSQTCLFGKFARCQVRALYRKLRRKWYIPTLSAFEISIDRWWIATIHNVSTVLVFPPTSRADWVVYTDASSISEIIAVVAFEGTPTGYRSVSEAFSARAPSVWKRQFRYTRIIYGFELLAPVAFLWTWRTKLAGKDYHFY